MNGVSVSDWKFPLVIEVIQRARYAVSFGGLIVAVTMVGCESSAVRLLRVSASTSTCGASGDVARRNSGSSDTREARGLTAMPAKTREIPKNSATHQSLNAPRPTPTAMSNPAIVARRRRSRTLVRRVLVMGRP